MFRSALYTLLLCLGVSGSRPVNNNETKPLQGFQPSKVLKDSISATITNSQPIHVLKRYPQWDSSKEVLKFHSKSECWRCPENKTMIVPKGQTSIILESFGSLVGINCPTRSWEILYGPQPYSKLFEGSYPLLLRFSSSQLCFFMYNVIVRKCEPLISPKELRVNCSSKNTWGSKCKFSCDPGYWLSGYSKTNCNNKLKWTNPTPTCLEEHKNDCTVPVSPTNGFLSCKKPNNDFRRKGRLPNGTICHYQCHEGYLVPSSHRNLTVTTCIMGRWDTNQDPICTDGSDSYRFVTANAQHNTRKLSRRRNKERCVPGLCKHGGSCYVILGVIKCICAPGYTGPTCLFEI